MQCTGCKKQLTESTVIDNIEYFVCSECGECIEVNYNQSTLDVALLHRVGDKSTHESYSSDFIVNGKSLLITLTSSYGTHKDFLGCFARGWNELNISSLKQLLLQEQPEAESGRRLIYLCPECADIRCGAYGCKINKVGQEYIWSDFAYENGYEEPIPINNIGPFKFDTNEYEKIINAANTL